MFIKESLRLYPPVTNASRKLDKDLTVKSDPNKHYKTVVPKDTIMGSFMFILHRNEAVWEDPEVGRFSVTYEYGSCLQ